MENSRNELFFYTENKKTGRRVTVAGIIDLDNNALRIGLSECSKKDAFIKKKGRVIAKGRALSNKAEIIPLVANDTPVQQFINIAKAM